MVVLGTAHVSEFSAQQVRTVMRQVNPDAVRTHPLPQAAATAFRHEGRGSEAKAERALSDRHRAASRQCLSTMTTRKH